MNLLPKATSDFTQIDYWNSFFKKRGKKSFEWYGEYPELCGILHKYIRPRDKILVIGCGNSSLSSDLYDVGYKQIMNIDVSGVVIKQMKARSKARPGLEYQQMDATNTTFADGEFNVVLDKGTLDAMMPDSSPETLERIDRLFSEVDRVLTQFGRYVCISLLQQHILLRLATHCSGRGWMLRICCCQEAEHRSDNSSGFVFPVFVVVCTKLKVASNEPIFEVCQSLEVAQRMATVDETMAAVKTMQDTALVCSGLNRCNIANSGEVTVELSRPHDVYPRYTITVADSPKAKDASRMKFAAFIVPQGREREWLFGTPEGRQELLDNSGFDRLAVIRLHREHKYESLQVTQDETAETVLRLAPNFKGSSPRPKIPFLTVASDLGSVTVLARGQSQISGEFIIEDSQGAENQWYRRLVFLTNQNVVQSEAKLKTVENNGETKHTVDVGYLACDHHKYMTMGVSMVNQIDAPFEVLVIGLGGGGLCTYIRNCFPTVRITAVDIDPAIYEVATSYFDLQEDSQLKVIIEDGVDYLKSSVDKGTKFSVVLFDVDSKDSSQGLSYPPASFLEPEILSVAADCLTDTGHDVAGTKFSVVLFDVDSKDSSQGLSCPPASFLEPEILSAAADCLTDTGHDVAGTKFSVVLFDVDSKDSSQGLSCPPASFLEPEILSAAADCLTDTGHDVAGTKFSVVLFDVDSKDSSQGLSCPPASFLEPEILSAAADCLTDTGHDVAGTKFSVVLFDVDSKDSSQGLSCPPASFLEPEILSVAADCLTDTGHDVAGTKFSVVLFDVDSKDSSQGLSCPPASFLEPEILSAAADCLTDTGHDVAGTKFSVVLFDVDSKDSSQGLSCPPASFLEPEILSAAADCLTDTGHDVAGTKFSVVLFDVDSKDSSQGLSCPPASFLEPEILSAAADCLTDTGLFVLNFVCRVEEIRQETKAKLEKLFSKISSVKLKQEVNEIFFCWKNGSDLTMEKAAKSFNATIKSRQIQEDDLIDLEDLPPLVRVY